MTLLMSVDMNCFFVDLATFRTRTDSDPAFDVPASSQSLPAEFTHGPRTKLVVSHSAVAFRSRFASCRIVTSRTNDAVSK